MQTNNRILDDMARVTTGALGALGGVRREIEDMVRHQFHRLLDGMDLVTRDEFETVRMMAEKARSEQEALSERVARLEAALEAQAEKPGKPKSDRVEPKVRSKSGKKGEDA